MGKTKLERFNLLHKFLFDEAMEDKEAYQAMISILLENEVEILGRPETEKEIRISPELRQVRLDVDSLLITPFDLFGRGLYRYTFEGTCRECPDLKLKDGAVRIFINTRGKNAEEFSSEFLELMKYIEKTTNETAETLKSPRIKRIHERVCQVRRFEKVGLRYIKRCEELAYAKEDGMQIKLIELVCKKLRKNKTPEQIAEDLEEDIEIIRSICRAAEEFAPEYDSNKIFEKCSA